MRLSILLSAMLVLLAACVSSGCTTAQPASLQSPMQFSVIRPCERNASPCAPRLLASGRFERDSATRLADFLASDTGRALPVPTTVVFNSPGGNIAGAMAMGRLIRQWKLDTRVSATLPPASAGNPSPAAVCASACALAFLGGVRRHVEPGARFGVHQFALAAGGNLGDSATQGTMVRLAAYITEMGVDRRLLDIASLVPPEKMHWITQAQAQTLRVDNAVRKLASWELRAGNEGTPLMRVQQLAPEGDRVSTIVLQRTGDSVRVLASVAVARRSVQADSIARFPVGAPPAIEFLVDGNAVPTRPATAWQRADSAVYYQFNASATLPLSALPSFGRAQRLAVSDGLAPTLAALSLSTDLSTENLGPNVALLLRSP